jgi:predicted DNA-binding protein
MRWTPVNLAMTTKIKDRLIAFRLPTEIWEQVNALALQWKITKSEIVRRALLALIEHRLGGVIHVADAVQR